MLLCVHTRQLLELICVVKEFIVYHVHNQKLHVPSKKLNIDKTSNLVNTWLNIRRLNLTNGTYLMKCHLKAF
jgi:hypothetical protein